MKNSDIKKKSDFLVNRLSKRVRNPRRAVFISHNFSDLEDRDNAFKLIRELTVKAGNQASAKAKAAGLSRVYARNSSDIVKISPNGNIVHIAPRMQRPNFYIKYKPSTIFHVVTK